MKIIGLLHFGSSFAFCALYYRNKRHVYLSATAFFSSAFKIMVFSVTPEPDTAFLGANRLQISSTGQAGNGGGDADAGTAGEGKK